LAKILSRDVRLGFFIEQGSKSSRNLKLEQRGVLKLIKTQIIKKSIEKTLFYVQKT
jgi:hypothetical protein